MKNCAFIVRKVASTICSGKQSQAPLSHPSEYGSTLIGTPSRKSDGVLDNFRNYFVICCSVAFKYSTERANSRDSRSKMLGKDEAAEQLGKASKNTKTCSTPEQSRCADTPLSDEYAVGSPQFKRATIHLENGNDIVIEAPENGPENRYIRKMTVNGKRSSPFINYSEIKEGAKIRLEMKDNPAKFDVQKYTDR